MTDKTPKNQRPALRVIGGTQATRKPISKKIRFEVFKRDRFTCQYCGGKAPQVELHLDHYVPVSLGGPNDIWNLITACAGCNLWKRDEPIRRILVDDWYYEAYAIRVEGDSLVISVRASEFREFARPRDLKDFFNRHGGSIVRHSLMLTQGRILTSGRQYQFTHKLPNPHLGEVWPYFGPDEDFLQSLGLLLLEAVANLKDPVLGTNEGSRIALHKEIMASFSPGPSSTLYWERAE